MSALPAILLALFADVSVGNVPASAHHRFDAIRCDAKHRCVVSRTLVDKLLANTEALASTVRVVPALVDGKPDGFKLYAMRANSVWSKLGFQNGDELQTINDYDLTTPAQALIAYASLRNETRFVVRIVRRGEPLTLQYEIR